MTSTESTATPSFDEITNLLTESAYDPSSVPSLESYAAGQARALLSPTAAGAAPTTPYHFDANRTLIKLYQFFPFKAKPSHMSLILMLSLLEYPSTDFCALGALMSSLPKDEWFPNLNSCAELLETCQFKEFWTYYKTNLTPSQSEGGESGTADQDNLLALLVKSPVAEDKFRCAIWKVLGLTYLSAPMSVILTALNLGSKKELEDFVGRNEEAKRGLDSMTDGEVCFVKTKENTKRSRVFKESVKFDVIANLTTSNAKQ